MREAARSCANVFHIFASAGALAFVNAYSGSAVASALYHAFAERKPRRSLPHLEHLL